MKKKRKGGLPPAGLSLVRNPKPFEVYEFFQKNYDSLRFSPSVSISQRNHARNSKRLQAEARRAVCREGIGTKSQQALQLMREQTKAERKAESKVQRRAEARRRFELKQQKKKQKHRGR